MQKQDQEPANGTTWELLEDFADIRDELEDALQTFEIMAADIRFGMDDIRDELDALHAHLCKCSRNLNRFGKPAVLVDQALEEQNELPFSK